MSVPIFVEDCGNFNLACPNNDCEKSEIDLHEEGMVCDRCLSIWNECSNCPILVDGKNLSYRDCEYNNELQTRENVDQITWMKLIGWKLSGEHCRNSNHQHHTTDDAQDATDCEQSFHPLPFVPCVSKDDGSKYIDDGTLFLWKCEKCEFKERTNCD